MALIYDADSSTWNVVAEGVSTQLLKINNDGTAELALQDGETMTVALNAQGISEAQAALCSNAYALR